MELEEMIEPVWPAEDPVEYDLEQDDAPTGWASDHPGYPAADPTWVDAYEL